MKKTNLTQLSRWTGTVRSETEKEEREKDLMGGHN